MCLQASLKNWKGAGYTKVVRQCLMPVARWISFLRALPLIHGHAPFADTDYVCFGAV